MWDELVCELFHSGWAKVVSYSRQGAWRCTRPGCRAQQRADRESQHKLDVARQGTGFENTEVFRHDACQMETDPGVGLPGGDNDREPVGPGRRRGRAGTRPG